MAAATANRQFRAGSAGPRKAKSANPQRLLGERGWKACGETHHERQNYSDLVCQCGNNIRREAMLDMR